MFFGKLIGGFIGYSSLGIFGALIGLMIGHFFDKGFAGIFKAASPEQIAKRQQVFFTTVFSLMGKVAKSDGRVSSEEVQHTEQFMTQLGLSPEHRKQAIELFKAGAVIDLTTVMNEFNQVCGLELQLKHLLLVYVTGVSLADGVLDPAEESLLREITKILGFPNAYFDKLLSMIRGQDHFSGGQSNAASQDNIANAYGALGVEPSVTDAQLKKAYRRLMSEFHPDKLMGKGVPDDMIKVATERSQEIQTAYDLLKSHRKKTS